MNRPISTLRKQRLRCVGTRPSWVIWQDGDIIGVCERTRPCNRCVSLWLYRHYCRVRMTRCNFWFCFAFRELRQDFPSLVCLWSRKDPGVNRWSANWEWTAIDAARIKYLVLIRSDQYTRVWKKGGRHAGRTSIQVLRLQTARAREVTLRRDLMLGKTNGKS